MSIQDQTNSASFIGDGTTTQFIVNFISYTSNPGGGQNPYYDIYVGGIDRITNETITYYIGADYTITTSGANQTTITFLVAPSATTNIQVYRAYGAYEQDMTFNKNQQVDLVALETQLDRFAVQDLQLKQFIDRCIQFPLVDKYGSTSARGNILPSAKTRAQNVLAFGTQGECTLIPSTNILDINAAIAAAAASAAAALVSETHAALSESNAKASELAAKASELAAQLAEQNAVKIVYNLGTGTFNPDYAAAGYYKKGTKLYDDATGLEVISRKDNNTDNFVTDRSFLNPLSWDWYSTVSTGTIIQTLYTENDDYPLGFTLCSSGQTRDKIMYARLWNYAVKNKLVTTVLAEYQNSKKGYFLDRGDGTFSPPNLYGSRIFLSGAENVTVAGSTIGLFQAGNVGTHTHGATTTVAGGNHSHGMDHVHSYIRPNVNNPDWQSGDKDFYPVLNRGTPVVQDNTGGASTPVTQLSGNLGFDSATTIANNTPGGANVPDNVSYAYFIKY